MKNWTIKVGKNSYSYTIYEVALLLSFLCLVVLASPYVAAQFKGLVAFGDVIWNVCLDFLILNGAIVVLVMLSGLLTVFNHWVERMKNKQE